MKTLSRRILSAAAAAFLVVGLPVVTAVSAQATSGGGCLNPPADYAYVTYSPCISIDSTNRIAYDAYITFYDPHPGTITGCTVVENIRDDTVKNTIAQSTKNCTAAARAGTSNFRAGPFFRFQNGNGHAYHNYVWVTITYQSGGYTTAVANSPEQYT